MFVKQLLYAYRSHADAIGELRVVDVLVIVSQLLLRQVSMISALLTDCLCNSSLTSTTEIESGTGSAVSSR